MDLQTGKKKERQKEKVKKGMWDVRLFHVSEETGPANEGFPGSVHFFL